MRPVSPRSTLVAVALVPLGRLACCLGLAAGLAAPAAAQQINTAPPVGDFPYVILGRTSPGETRAVGQRFVAPDGVSRLDRFQFFAVRVLPDPVVYRAYVVPFDSALARVSGPAVYESAPQTGDAVGLMPAALTFVTGGVNVVGGRSYLAFLSTAEFFQSPAGAGSNGSLRMLLGSTPCHPGLAYTNDSPTVASLTGTAWAPLLSGTVDFAFTASFSTTQSVVPEPRTGVLLGSGLAALAVVGMKGRRPGAPR